MKAVIALGYDDGKILRWQEVTAYKTNTPGLIVTCNGWNVTHAKTGRFIAGPFYDKQHALDWANKDQGDKNWEVLNPVQGNGEET